MNESSKVVTSPRARILVRDEFSQRQWLLQSFFRLDSCRKGSKGQRKYWDEKRFIRVDTPGNESFPR